MKIIRAYNRRMPVHPHDRDEITTDYTVTGVGTLYSTTAPEMRAVSIAGLHHAIPGRERAGNTRIRLEIERDDDKLDDIIAALVKLRAERDAAKAYTTDPAPSAFCPLSVPHGNNTRKCACHGVSTASGDPVQPQYTATCPPEFRATDDTVCPKRIETGWCEHKVPR